MDKRRILRRTGQRKRRSGQRKRRSGQRKRRNSRKRRNGEPTHLYLLGGVVWNSVPNVVNF